MASLERAVILTEKNVPRLQLNDGDIPIPLRRVCGVPLLKRQIDAVARAGIKSCVVILGSQGDFIQRTMEADPSIQIPIEWVRLPSDITDEGQCVLSTKQWIDQNYLLLTPDHLFEAPVVQQFVHQCEDTHEVVVAVDRKLDEVFDIRVANKVQLDHSLIKNMGNKLKEYDAVDTGMYCCPPSFFAALEKFENNSKSTLNDALKFLSTEGKLRYFDIQKGWWFDLDIPGTLERAEDTLFNRLRKSTDGFVSRHFNRPLSLRLSRLLVNTPVTGNHITYFSLVLGLISAALFAFGSYASVLTGAILFQVLSILDGCDGELAKIKLQDSKKGQFLDTVIDHATYLAFLIAVTIGYYRQQQEYYIFVFGFFTLFNILLGVKIVSEYSKRTKNWSFVAANKAFFPVNEKTGVSEATDLVSKVFSYIKFAIRRDFFAFATLVAAIFGGLAVIFWVAFVATLLYAVGALYGKNRYLGSAPAPTSP